MKFMVLSLGFMMAILLPATHVGAQQIYEEFHYDAQGSLIQYKGPVYGPNPDPNELAALTWTWTYQYPTGYVLVMSETGPMGLSSTYAYDASYNVSQVARQGGAVLETWSYDSSGRPTQLAITNGTETQIWQYQYPSASVLRTVDPRGKWRQITFDASGHPVMEAGSADSAAALDAMIAAGQVRTYTYNTAGKLVSFTNEIGSTWSRTYDGMGNVLSETDPNGLVVTHTYDPTGLRLTTTLPGAPQGQTSYEFYYDAAGRLQVAGKRIDAQTVRYEGYRYDVTGNLTHVVGPAYSVLQAQQMIAGPTNVVFSYTYDALGRKTAETRLDGQAKQWTYDARGNVLTESVSGQGTSTSTYDYQDNLVSSVDAIGCTTTYVRDTFGRPVQTTGPWYDANGNGLPDDADPASVRVCQFNLAGLEVSSQVDAFPVVTTTYDYLLPLSVTSQGLTTTYQYDAAGRILLETSPTGVQTHQVYDAAGRLVSTTVGEGTASEVRTTYGLDAGGRAVSVSRYPNPGSPAGALTETFTYDAGGRLSGGTSMDGTAWSQQCDLACNVVSAGPVGGLQTTRQYSADGLLVTLTARGGPTVQYTYDASMRLSTVVEGGTRTWSYAYDSLGRIATLAGPEGVTVHYAYDANGRLTSETFQPAGYVRTRTYDARGRLASVADGTASYSYTYDQFDRLVSRTDQSSRTLSFTYQNNGLPACVTYPGGDQFTYGYDAYLRPITISRTTGSQTSTVANILYDPLDRIASWTHANGYTDTFGYDGLDRLIQAALCDTQLAPVETQALTRDGAGRVTQVAYLGGDVESFAYDVSGQLVSASRTGAFPYNATYTYDGAGNLVGENFNGGVTTYTRGSQGELASKTDAAGTTTYTYDGGGKLLSTIGATGTTTYAYDPRGLPTTVSVGATGTTINFEYDPWGDRAAKIVGSSTEAYVQDCCRNRIEVYSNGALSESSLPSDCRRRAESWTTTAQYSYFYAFSDSVDRVIDQAGTVVGRYVYDPFGVVIGGAAAPFGSPRFQGLHYDVEFNMHDNEARMYSAALRGFTMPDPLRLRTSEGTYQRSHNDPVNLRDPSGLCTQGDIIVQADPSTSPSAVGGHLGGTFYTQLSFECHTVEIPYSVPPIPPCWPRQRIDVDFACVMVTSDCTVKVPIKTAAVGSNVKASYGGSVQKFYIDQAGGDTLVWHENGHVAMIAAYLRGFWAEGKKSLGGADSKRYIHKADVAIGQAQKHWDKLWAKLSRAMAAGVRHMSQSLDGPTGFDGSVTEVGGRRGRAPNGNALVPDQRYRLPGGAEGDPKSHENNDKARTLHRMAEQMGSRNAHEKGLGKYPCKCGP